MDHTRNLSFVFSFDLNTVAAISHGDHRVLKVISGTAIYQGSKLGMDAVVCKLHAAANMHQPAACIVADLILGKDASADFCGKWGKGLQAFKHAVKGILFCLTAVISGVGFYPVGIFKKSCNSKKFSDSKKASDLQTL